MTQEKKARIVKRGDRVVCQEHKFPEDFSYKYGYYNYLDNPEEYTPHPDHLKYFEDRIGEVVEIELIEGSTMGAHFPKPQSYAVPKVDEWQTAFEYAGRHATINLKPFSDCNEDEKIKYNTLCHEYLKSNFTITKKQ